MLMMIKTFENGTRLLSHIHRFHTFISQLLSDNRVKCKNVLTICQNKKYFAGSLV